MIAARELKIMSGDTPYSWSWSWKSLPQSRNRLAEVAELQDIRLLEIHGKINTGMLSPETTYAAYLVRMFIDAFGFDYTPVDVLVGIVGGESCTRTVCLNIREGQNWPRPFCRAYALELQDSIARERGDGWLEIELGEYFNEEEPDEELEMSLMEVKRFNLKRGLIIQGIEIRSKESNKIKEFFTDDFLEDRPNKRSF